MKKISLCGLPLLASLFIGFGYASWTFNNNTAATKQTSVVISHFNFNAQWTNSDILPDTALDAATDFEEALNNPNSEAGKAWTEAWKSKHNGSGGTQYIGSMDRNAGDEIEMIFGDDANYIITRHDANSYTLYITYEALNTPLGTVKPVYKTIYMKDATGVYVPTESWVGQCDRNIYYIGQVLTYAFNTESFKEI